MIIRIETRSENASSQMDLIGGGPLQAVVHPKGWIYLTGDSEFLANVPFKGTLEIYAAPEQEQA